MPNSLAPTPAARASVRLLVRSRGPNVMPGYWRAPEQTAAAFDAEGYYSTGDAVRPVDADDPGAGLMFDDRIAEDFKLSTGRFVSVGPLRARVILGRGEITDHGSINQRAALTRRAPLIDARHLGPASDPGIILPQRTLATAPGA